jgi:hypothetical protein
VVQITTKYSDILGAVKLIKMFESFKSFAPPLSPSAGELFNGCASTSFVSWVYSYFIVITLSHPITPHLAKVTSCLATTAAIPTAIPTATATTTAAITKAPSQLVIPLPPRLAKATSHLAATAVIAAATPTPTTAITATTSAAITKVPHCDGCSPWDSERDSKTTMPEVWEAWECQAVLYGRDQVLTATASSGAARWRRTGNNSVGRGCITM